MFSFVNFLRILNEDILECYHPNHVIPRLVLVYLMIFHDVVILNKAKILRLHQCFMSIFMTLLLVLYFLFLFFLHYILRR